jgi:hypothetical protein
MGWEFDLSVFVAVLVDDGVSVFDLAANKTVAAAEVSAHVYALAFAGDLLLAACADGVLRAWHVAKFQTQVTMWPLIDTN